MRATIPVIMAVLGCVLTSCATQPPSEVDDVKAAVRRIDLAFADETALAAEIPPPLTDVRAGQPRFVDRVAPFGWDTARYWFESWRKSGEQQGITARKMTILDVRHAVVDGRWASVVVTARLDTVRLGVAGHEIGKQLFLMTRATGAWELEGYAWFGEGEVTGGAEADNALAGARKLVDKLNATYVIPSKFVDHGAIEDNSIDDWQVVGETPEHEAQTHGPVTPGDPDAMFVLGPAGRLVTINGAAYVLFPATIASRSGGPAKGHGTLLIALVATSDWQRGLNERWTYFDEIAWAPD